MNDRRSTSISRSRINSKETLSSINFPSLRLCISSQYFFLAVIDVSADAIRYSYVRVYQKGSRAIGCDPASHRQFVPFALMNSLAYTAMIQRRATTSIDISRATTSGSIRFRLEILADFGSVLARIGLIGSAYRVIPGRRIDCPPLDARSGRIRIFRFLPLLLHFCFFFAS